MSAKKQAVIVCMVFIMATVCMIFILFSGNESAIDNRLDEAQKYFDEMDYDNAIAVYNDLLKSGSNSTNVYLGLADAYMKKGNQLKAVEILERGLPYSGNDSRFYKKLSELTGENYFAEADEFLPENDVPNETTPPEIQQTEETIVASGTEAIAETETEAAETSAPVTESTEPAVTTTQPEQPPVTTTAPAVPAVNITTTTTAKPLTEVPDFTGMNKNDAQKLAKSLNIKLELEYKDNSNYENDVIYSQSKIKGTKVAEQSTVKVYVAVNNKPSEEELNVQAFFAAAKEWGELNSSRVKSVSANEKNSAVTISMSSAKKLLIDSSVMEAFAKCKNAVMVINSSDISMTIKSSSVTKASKLDLSTNVYGNESRTTAEIGSTGSLNCTVTAVILRNNISSDDINGMNLYYNNKKSGSFSINDDGQPVITISSGGTYVIR